MKWYYWLAAAAYCGVIYWLSSGPIEIRDVPEFPQRDKLAHLLVYGGLTLLLAAGVWHTGRWHGLIGRFVFPFVFAVGFGVFDEFHQANVPTRNFDPLDVVANTAAALLALALFRWRVPSYAPGRVRARAPLRYTAPLPAPARLPNSGDSVKPLVSVVVPFFNEEDNISPLAERVLAVADSLPEYDFECVFVNDGSRDATGARIDALAEREVRVRPVHLARNQGQSAAVWAGFQRARGEYLLTLDGDLQNDPADFPRFLELLREYDCVCGYRAKRNDSLVRKISSRVANKVRGAILQDGVRDSGCGAKGFRRSCLPHFLPFNGLHRFMPVFVRAAGLTLVETPVHHHARVHGISKYGIGNRLFRGIYDMIGVAWLRRRYVAVEIKDSQ